MSRPMLYIDAANEVHCLVSDEQALVLMENAIARVHQRNGWPMEQIKVFDTPEDLIADLHGAQPSDEPEALSDLARSAYEEAMAFGVSVDSFIRLATKVQQRYAAAYQREEDRADKAERALEEALAALGPVKAQQPCRPVDLIDEFYNGTAEKDWPAWGEEAVHVLERIPAGQARQGAQEPLPLSDFPQLQAVLKQATLDGTLLSVQGAAKPLAQGPLGVLERGEGGEFRVRPYMDSLMAIYAMPPGEYMLYAAPTKERS